MNKAFTKEDDEGPSDLLPDREIPPHANLVTAEGLAQIERMQAELAKRLSVAQDADDRDAAAHIARDMRYWNARRSTAQLMAPPDGAREVKFGARVTIARDDGRRQTFRIVGQDEADPERGTLSYVSPMAQALMGRALGDTITVAGGEAEIVAIA